MAVKDFFTSGFDFDYLFMPSGAVDTAKEVSAAQERLVQQRAAEGKIDSQKQAQLLQEIAGTTTYDTYFQDPANRPTTAFADELKYQFTQIPRNIRDTLSGITALPFKLIPANLWLLLLLAGGLYLVWKLNILEKFAYRAPK